MPKSLALAVLLIFVASTSMAQALRLDQRDAMTDERLRAIVMPSTDGRADLLVGCHGVALDIARMFLALGSSFDVMLRFGSERPLKARASLAEGGHIVRLELETPLAFEEQSAKAEKLIVRIASSTHTDLTFDLLHDNKYAFRAVAELIEANPVQAWVAFDTLTETVARAAAGQDANVVTLMKAMRVVWQEKDGKPLPTGDFIGGIMTAFANTKNQRTLEDAGRTLFGPTWPELRPLAELKGDRAYRTLNQPLAAQLAWLKDACAAH